MIESSLLTPSLINDLYMEGPFQDVIESDDFMFKYDEADFLCNYDSISSNSSDIDGFNFDDFETNSALSDEFVSHIFGDDLYSSFSHIDNYNQSSTYPSNLNKSNVTLSKKKRSACSQESIKSWSSMTAEEQNKTLLEISDTACRMGIAEQIEVIRIMKPGVEISAEMTEFTLDVSLLNDTKWKKIQEYFKRHKRPVKSRKSSKAGKSNSSVSRTSKKPRQKKEKNFPETDEFRKLKRKQQRQGRKEEKSGLFVYEKVVKFSSLEEDEDVNILE
ncbi:protein FAM199X [Parasteatoda tepidariorum]|nr:uncharacterized protein LOC107454980 [Parasteatoda tepidariorum]